MHASSRYGRTYAGGGVRDGALAVGVVEAVHAGLEALGIAAELNLRLKEEVVAVLAGMRGMKYEAIRRATL